MLVLLSVLLIYVAGWLANLYYWHAPDALLLFALVAANLGYGIIAFRIDYFRWSERMLQGISYPLLLYSYIFNQEIYELIISPTGNEDLKLIFVITVVVATPLMAITGPVRTAIMGIAPSQLDDNDDPFRG